MNKALFICPIAKNCEAILCHHRKPHPVDIPPWNPNKNFCKIIGLNPKPCPDCRIIKPGIKPGARHNDKR
jgi:hypothetical protein